MALARRSVLRMSGVVLAGMVTGCTGGDGNDNGGADDTLSPTPSPLETPTPSPTLTPTETPTPTPTETPTPTPTETPTPTPTETPTPTSTPSPTSTSEAAIAQEKYPDYNWSKLEGTDPVPTRTILMERTTFKPLKAAVKPGTEVRIINQDPIQHTVTIPKLDIDETLDSGMVFSFTVNQAGTYDYVCTLHPPGMLGRLIVTSNPPTPA